jgi:hypothetical protein
MGIGLVEVGVDGVVEVPPVGHHDSGNLITSPTGKYLKLRPYDVVTVLFVGLAAKSSVYRDAEPVTFCATPPGVSLGSIVYVLPSTANPPVS